jgi:hypothetical protein
LNLLFSGEDIDRFRESFPHNRQKVDPKQLRRVSFIQQITHIDRSRVGFDNMRMYVTIDPISTMSKPFIFSLAEADERCRLRVLLSTSKEKPSKPGMIMGEWLFDFRSLAAYAVHKQGE